jgi:diadenosine tetraphosphatase ApaH/serine/threonine PP2A family protein phosphatase
MRYLILTDIHANLEALDACLADARARAFDRALVLGDIVGYGADPNAVIDRVLALNPAAIVRGNHDKVASGLEWAEGFNSVARSAAHWTLDTLTPAHRAWLVDLPEGPAVVSDLIEICHGSPFDEDAYIFSEPDAARAFEFSRRPLCLFGHTHHPMTFVLADNVLDRLERSTDGESQVPIQEAAKYLVNPGSVGQPRDGDPRAAYAIVDEDRRRVELYRLPYAVGAAQAKIIAAGLPEVLAQRLGLGR